MTTSKGVHTVVLDPHFSVGIINRYENPFQTMYLAMRRDKNACSMKELTDHLPDERECASRVMKHIYSGEPHHGVGEHVSITFAADGFPHDVAMQARTHRIATFDVCSQRYTGQHIIDWVKKLKEFCLAHMSGYIHRNSLDSDWLRTDDAPPLSITDLSNTVEHFLCISKDRNDFTLLKEFLRIFYVRAEGQYQSRDGKVDISFDDIMEATTFQMVSALFYYQRVVLLKEPPETARHYLAQGIRQNFVFTLNARSLMHFLDLRSKFDAQYEIRCLSELMFLLFKEWMPELADWYETRYGKARLSP